MERGEYANAPSLAGRGELSIPAALTVDGDLGRLIVVRVVSDHGSPGVP